MNPVSAILAILLGIFCAIVAINTTIGIFVHTFNLLAWLFTTPEGLCASFIVGCIFAALKDTK